MDRIKLSLQKTQDEIFEEKRNELVNLLCAADSVVVELRKSGYFSSIPEELQEGIERTRKRCYENLFDIVLIAPFQSGKSTTIGAFCDGREISPRGLGGGGIKTSACVVKVQNTEDKEEDERAIIKWRTDTDLIRRVNEAIGATARILFPSDKKELLDFRKSPDNQYLKEALAREVANYRDAPENYAETVDLLRFALIILNYHDSEELRSIKSRKYFSIQEIQNLIRFPKSFVARWRKCLNENKFVREEFDISEVIYAFIEEVTCKIHSKTLERTGMAIVDAPGLFISSYDTEVATMAMQNASAIWYLFNGEREPSKEDKEALAFISKAQFAPKVFFGINYRQDPEKIKGGEIEENTLIAINQSGFKEAHHSKLLYYNAFLALRAAQGLLILNENLDPQTEEQIILDAKSTSKKAEEKIDVKSAWMKTTKKVLQAVTDNDDDDDDDHDDDDDDNIIKQLKSNGLCHSTVKALARESGWEQVNEEIKQYVFQKKAPSILVDMGCQPVIEILTSVENNLKIREQEAEKSREDAEKEWGDALIKMEDFIIQSQQLTKEYIDNSWDETLADDFWKNAILTCTERVAQVSAELIDKEMTTLNVLGDGVVQVRNTIVEGWNKLAGWSNENFLGKVGLQLDRGYKEETLKEKCEDIVRRKFEEQFGIFALGWFNEVQDGRNEKYNNQVRNKVVKLCKEINREWNHTIDENIYLKGLDVNIPAFTGKIGSDIKKISVKEPLERQFQGMADQIGNEFFKQLLSLENLLAGAGLVLTFLPVDLIFPGLGFALTAISIAVAAVWNALTKNDYSRTNELRQKIVGELKTALQAQENEIKASLQSKLSVIRVFYESVIEQSFVKMKCTLDRRISESKQKFNQAQAERNEVAKVASEVRINYVEPITARMNSFKASVEEIWK